MSDGHVIVTPPGAGEIARLSTTVFTLATLFAFTGSVSTDAVCAVLVNVPAVSGFTTSVTVIFVGCPAGRLPRFVNVTTAPLRRYVAGDADTRLALANGGSVFVNPTAVAVAGPAFEIVSV